MPGHQFILGMYYYLLGVCSATCYITLIFATCRNFISAVQVFYDHLDVNLIFEKLKLQKNSSTTFAEKLEVTFPKGSLKNNQKRSTKQVYFGSLRF